MKITKSELKMIVKECLVEILSEGLGDTIQHPATTRPSFPSPRPAARIPMGATPSVPVTPSMQARPPARNESANLQLTPRRPPPNFKETIKREAGGNKIMESILADTAASTLPKMMQNEGRPQIPSTAGGGVAEHIVATANPEDLFGDEVASKWADLAFMDSPLKK